MSVLFWLISFALEAEIRIEVTAQNEFDGLTERIRERIRPGEEVTVSLGKGVYFYREGHLDLSGIISAGSRIRIEGNASLLIPYGTDYQLDKNKSTAFPDAFSPEDGFVSLTRKEPVELRQEIRRCKTHPIPVSVRRKLFCFKCDEPDLVEEDARDAFIILTQWYVGAVYKVKMIRNGWLYFYADKKYQTKLYEELRYGRCRPRYILYNQRSADSLRIVAGEFVSPCRDTVRRLEATTFCRVSDSRVGCLSLNGMRFLGNRSGGYLLQFDSVAADSIVVSDCSFVGIKSHLVGITHTSHFRFQDNSVSGCCLRGVYSDWQSVDTRVLRNTFRDHGKMLTTAPAVYCQGPGFLIAGNLFENFAYSAIGLGTHYVETDSPYAAGIVEENEICQTADFRSAPMATLIDSGAIYVWTQNRRTVIRRNYIHDISGPHGNRAILCDDGTINVSIYDNLILGIDNNAYCIDLRKRFAVERKRNSKVRKVNVGNKMDKADFYSTRDRRRR